MRHRHQKIERTWFPTISGAGITALTCFGFGFAYCLAATNQDLHFTSWGSIAEWAAAFGGVISVLVAAWLPYKINKDRQAREDREVERKGIVLAAKLLIPARTWLRTVTSLDKLHGPHHFIDYPKKFDPPDDITKAADDLYKLGQHGDMLIRALAKHAKMMSAHGFLRALARGDELTALHNAWLFEAIGHIHDLRALLETAVSDLDLFIGDPMPPTPTV